VLFNKQSSIYSAFCSLYANKKIAMAELPEKKIFRTEVKLQTLMPDLLLILFAIAFPITSFIIDINHHRADWFARSGAVSAIIGIVLASRSIKKHNQKFFSNIELNDLGKEMLHTSIPQLKIDKWTLVLSIIGTLIWAYGDKVIELFLE
jgi:Gpi18-like mannosyltransferase